MATQLSPELQERGASLEEVKEASGLDLYWRAANYLGAAQLYLQDNGLLEDALLPEQVKSRLLGRWGGVPGINFVCTHLNRLIRATDSSVMLVTGPGNGGSANLANLYLEGTLGEVYPDLTRDRDGLNTLLRRFATPGGLPGHLDPSIPGCIQEGSGRGYGLATAFGAAQDSPNLIVACIVGETEAETAPTAAAWQTVRHLDPATDGAVLPILLIEGTDGIGHSVFGAMSDLELSEYFHGLDYVAHVVHAGGETPEERIASHVDMARALDAAHASIRRIVQGGSHGPVSSEGRRDWPILIVRVPRGWTGPASAKTLRWGELPIKGCSDDPAALAALEKWLRSYQPEELFDDAGRPVDSVLANCPLGDRRMGRNPYATGGDMRCSLELPDFRAYAARGAERGVVPTDGRTPIADFLRGVLRRNTGTFRVFCPDETASVRLATVFRGATPLSGEARDAGAAPPGRIIEMRSELNCQGWLQGYLMTGREGLFLGYEAYAPVIDGMMNEYAHALKALEESACKRPIGSLNYLLVSAGWGQDDGGDSAHHPGFINNLLTKTAQQSRVYLPPDVNSLLCTIDHCLTSTGRINLIIASTRPTPVWLSMPEAASHCGAGASNWHWAGTFDGENPDVVLVGAGAYPQAEVMAAASMLKRSVPEMRIRVVNVSDLMVLEPDSFHPHGLSNRAFTELFTADRPVIFNFHGYPGAVKQLLCDRYCLPHFQINGYVEEGPTTTPFDLLVRNKIDRYHVALQALKAVAPHNLAVAARADAVQSYYEDQLRKHTEFVEANGVDMPDVADWRWE